jgi:hypothetical protein
LWRLRFGLPDFPELVDYRIGGRLQRVLCNSAPQRCGQTALEHPAPVVDGRATTVLTVVAVVKEDSVLERRYTDVEVAKLRHAIRDEAPMLAVADFSPGRWWGFNGIQTLVLTADHVHVVPQGLALTRDRLRRHLATADIETVSWRMLERFGRKVVRMTLEAGGKSRNYTSKYQNGADLATELTQLVSPT